MTKRLFYIIVALEVLVFAVPLGAISYFSQTSKWGTFSILVGCCVLVFTILQFFKSKPFLEKLKTREEAQFRLTRRLKEFGLSEIYNMQNPLEQDDRNRTTREIIGRGNVFSLLSLTAASYIDPAVRRHWDYLRDRLEVGSPIRLLLMNPFCGEYEVRDKLNSIGTRIDHKFRLDIMVELYNRYPNVSIRFSSTNIYCALFFSEAEMIYDPYHLGKVNDRIENRLFSLLIKNEKSFEAGNSYFAILKQHFEFLWSTGDDIEVFFQKYRSQVDNTPFKEAKINSRYVREVNK